MALSIFKDREFLRRLAVTAAVLAVYRLGCQVPLPGLNPQTLTGVYSAVGLAAERISIFALGIWPLVGVMIFAEIVKTLFPRLRAWELADPRNASKFAGWLIALALVVTAVQAVGYGGALEQVNTLVETPGLWFRVVCAMTLVAALALLIGMARVIDRDGLGDGVWLLFLAPMLAELPRTLAALYQLHLEGGYSALSMLASAAYTVLSVAALVSLLLADPTRRAIGAACLWSLLMALAALPWVMIFVGLLITGNDPNATAALMAPGTVFYLAVLAVLVCVAVYLYARSVRRAGAPLPWSALPIGGVLVLIALGADLLPRLFDLPLVPLRSIPLVVASVVATRILLDWNFIRARAPAQPNPDEQTV